MIEKMHIYQPKADQRRVSLTLDDLDKVHALATRYRALSGLYADLCKSPTTVVEIQTHDPHSIVGFDPDEIRRLISIRLKELREELASLGVDA